MRPALARPVRVLPLLLAVAALFAATQVHRVEAGVTVKIAAREVHGPLERSRTFTLPLEASNVAIHWRGRPDARVIAAFSGDGERFGRPQRVELDEVGEQRGDGETYGAVMAAHGAKAVRVTSDRPLARVSVLGLASGERQVRHRWQIGGSASASVDQPAVISRAGWGADESLRFKDGAEVWPPAFYPTQKLIVHHTATRNDDPDPAATIRSIYYYHAVTQGWGDIGYNFVVDEQGRTYEGRYSRSYAVGETPTGEDANGDGATAAHAQGYNSGTAGVALLGTLTDRNASAEAQAALERFLAWKADRHGIDPHGSAVYTNPVTGAQSTFPNIAGHRDVAATECPGTAFYAALPTIRDRVAALIAGTSPPPPDTTPPAAPASLTAVAGDRKATLDWADNADADLAGYRVHRRNPNGSWPAAPLAQTAASAYTATGLKNGTSYTFRVTAYDAAGNESGPSNQVTVTPLRRK